MSYSLPNANATLFGVPPIAAPQQTPAAGGAVAATPTTLTSPNSPSAANMAAPSLADPSTSNYEWTYPSTTDGKYFTATQAQVYIGNLFIDELVNLQYAFQGNRIPIFGYCSEEMDALGTGRRLVQGQLALNYVTEGYLYTVLSEFRKTGTVQSNALSSAADQAAVKLANLVNQRQALSSQPSANTSAQLAALDTQIATAAGKGGAATINAAKALLAGAAKTPAKSAITLAVPFSIRCTLTGAGRTVQRVLSNCVLISNEQVYDQSGQTMLDCYGFIGRSSN